MKFKLSNVNEIRKKEKSIRGFLEGYLVRSDYQGYKLEVKVKEIRGIKVTLKFCIQILEMIVVLIKIRK